MNPLFILISVIVPLIIYFFLPLFMMRFTGKSAVSRTPLLIAGVLFFIAWYLPSPLIRGMNTHFTTHFVGGGLFTGFLWLYIKTCARWKRNLLYDLAMLYFLVNALGVANELFEFAAVEAGLSDLDSQDTWWDLLANNLGAFSFWLGYAVVSRCPKRDSNDIASR